MTRKTYTRITIFSGIVLLLASFALFEGSSIFSTLCFILAVISLVVGIRDRNKPYPLPKPKKKPAAAPEPAPVAKFYTHASHISDKNAQEIRERFIVFDTETTGLNSLTDRLVSIGAIRFGNGREVDRFYTLINPGTHIPGVATEVNGITDEMVADAPFESEACRNFVEWLADDLKDTTIMVAYNSEFDAKFIRTAFERSGISGDMRHYDAMRLAKEKLKDVKNYKQTTVAEKLGIDSSGAHNALRDCEMCAAITLQLIER